MTKQPDWIEPMLATLTHEHFSDPAWLFERKLDGQRCLAFRNGASVLLFSRNHKPLADTYPELVEALLAQPGDDFIIDGEVVAFEGNRTSFSKLQRRLGIHDPIAARQVGVPVYFYVFDLLHVDGNDLTALPVRARKHRLARALTFGDPLRYTQHRNTEGEAYFEIAKGRGWEGLIAKRADAPYIGGRSKDWLKFKWNVDQELVIGGFTEPNGQRVGIGALLVGYYEGEQLRYAGKVGTGGSDKVLLDLRRQLDERSVEAMPFVDGPSRLRKVHWAQPELVAEIGFTEWTNDGKLRHPRFKGLRTDKAARDVVREN